MGIFNKICIVLKFHSKSATNVRNMNNMILIMVFHIRIETNSLVPTRKRNQLQKEKKKNTKEWKSIPCFHSDFYENCS